MTDLRGVGRYYARNDARVAAERLGAGIRLDDGRPLTRGAAMFYTLLIMFDAYLTHQPAEVCACTCRSHQAAVRELVAGTRH